MKLAKRLLAEFDRHLAGPRPHLQLLKILAGLLLGWWVYVPVHELLHAVGCLVSGGRVQQLEIAALYGGNLWAALLPFVTASSQYAGRLSGFDTGGSDLTYAVTILFPYLLVPVAFLLMGQSKAGGSAMTFGALLPPAFSPLLSVTGDFLEAASLLLFQLWPGDTGSFRSLISDDLFRLLGSGMIQGWGWIFVGLSQSAAIVSAILLVVVCGRLFGTKTADRGQTGIIKP